MRLAARIGAGFALLLALMAALATYQLALIQRLRADTEQLAGNAYAALEGVHELEAFFDELIEYTDKLPVARDRRYAHALAQMRERAEAITARLAALGLAPEENATLAALNERLAAYAALAEPWEDGCLSPVLSPDCNRDQPLVFERLRAVSDALARVSSASHAATEARLAQSDQRAEAARRVAWGAALLGLLLALGLAAAIVAPVARALRRLMASTAELATGNFAHRVETAGSPELASLAASFNEMAERLSELDRLKREFVAAVSHDLKAPLGAIQETIRALRDGLAGPVDPRQERLLRLALDSAARLEGMIRDLLDLAQLDAGAMEYRRAPCDLAASLGAAADLLEPLAREKRIEVRRELPAGGLTVECDERKVRQVIENLLSNAVKFTPAGGRVTLRLRPEARGAEVEVEDSGPGIPDRLKERVFERFFRTDHGTPGTGLGLVIARGIARGHGGRLWVEDAPDGGSRFRLLLPAAAPREGSAAGAAAPQEVGRGI